MRIALGVEYSGSQFSGWQLQDGQRTVQGCVEQALSKVADQFVRVHCAGRTDAGVHATGQVIHIDTDVQRDARSWVYGGNSNLPHGVSLLWAKEVEEDFHARFSATARLYRYVIFNRKIRPSWQKDRVSWDYRPLDVVRMQQAADFLVGEHDFSSFRAYACQANSPVRTIHRLNVRRHGQMIIIEVEANAFLHHMVRNLTGVLSTVGCGEREPEWAHEILMHKDRKLGGVTALPDGLYLCRVTYPERFGIPGTDQYADQVFLGM